MRSLLVTTIGCVFTTLVLILPSTHLQAMGISDVASHGYGWLLLPLIPLVASVTSHAPWWGLWLFPVSHLPALWVEPALMGSDVYRGGSGVAALMTIGAVWVGWYLVFTSGRPVVSDGSVSPSEVHGMGVELNVTVADEWFGRRPRAYLSWVVCALFIAIVLVFTHAVVLSGPETSPLTKSLAMALCLVVIWRGVLHYLVDELGTFMNRPHDVRTARLRLFSMRPPSSASTWSSFFQWALAVTLLLLWIGF